MSGFFKRYQKAIIWFVVISFFVGGVAFVSLNQAGVFDQPSGSESNALNIALVNGEPILTEAAGQAATTLLNQYQAYYQQLGRNVSELTAGAQGALFLLDLRAQGLQTVIQQALLSQAATERKIQVSRDDTNQQFAAQYNEILDMYELTEADLEQILLQQGQTLSAFKNSLRSDVERQLREASLREQVVGVINPTDDELAGHLEANIRQYGSAVSAPTLNDIKEQVRDDYIADQEQERFASWYGAYYDASDIEILQPLLNAYMMQNEDLDASIAEYERLLAAKEISDPYFEYYIGRAYESRALKLAGERAPLEELAEPTEEDLARIEELKAIGKADENQALEHYLNALNNALREDSVQADDAFINRVLLLDPTSTDAQYQLGKLLMERGDVLGAKEQFQEVISRTPDHVPSYIAYGDLALRQGATMQAVQQYEKALALQPNDVAILTKLVTAYLAVGYLGEAEQALRKIAQLDPGNAGMQIAEGEVAQARLKAAVEERDALLVMTERTPEDDGQLELLAQQIESYATTAIERFEQGIQRGGSLELNVRLGQVLLYIGRLDDAETQFRRAIVGSPYCVDAYRGMAEVLVQRGRIEDALENLRLAYSRSLADREKEQVTRRILDFAPDDLATRLLLAQALGKQYKWTAATREYAAVLDADPKSIEGYLGIAEAYRWRNESSTAMGYLQRGLSHTILAAEQVLVYEEMLVAAQSLVGAGRPLTSAGQDARIALSRLYLDQGRTNRAAELLARVRSDDPAYRADEVIVLLIEAGVEIPVIEDDPAVLPVASPDAE